MTRDHSTEEPCAAKVACTVLKTSGRGDPLAEFNRNNRVFRLMQKTRYKRRKPHTIEKALELELYARMVEHPLYRHNIRELRIPCQENSSLEMAA